MSFTSDIKDELLRVENENDCCALAELCGIVCFAGSVLYNQDKRVLKVSTESAAAAKKTFLLIKKLFGASGGIQKNKSRAGNGGNAYSIVVTDNETVDKILAGLSLYDEKFKKHVSFRIDKNISGAPCCKRALIRGTFLGGGSAAWPERGYHLEFTTHHAGLSGDLEKVLADFGVSPKTVKRKSYYVTYFKAGDEISDILALVGAYRGMMAFANIRIVKDTRNNVNRKVNCETANLDKTISAAFEQAEAIEKLKKAGVLDTLPEALKELALLRLKNKEASLSELARMTSPQLTKSGINHRFRKIMEMAEKVDGGRKMRKE